MTTVRKAVIPAAGLGTRFLPATKAQPKEMLPVVDKPSIQYVVEEAVRAGMDDILIITGRGKASIEDHFDRSIELELALESGGKLSELDAIRDLADLADVHFLRQGEALGLGHAVLVAHKHVGQEPFAVLLADDIMDERVPVLEDMVRAFGQKQASVIALKSFPGPDISLYGSIATDPDVVIPEPGQRHGTVVPVRSIVEKPPPEEAPSELGVMGRYVFTPEIFDAIRETKPGVGGEIQLTDAIGILLPEQPVYGYIFETGRYDIGKKQDYLRATVELALDRDDLGPEFGAYLAEVVRRRGLG